MYAIPAFLNDFNPANLSNPSSLQINSQPVAEGAGGRGEALEYLEIVFIRYHIVEISWTLFFSYPENILCKIVSHTIWTS